MLILGYVHKSIIFFLNSVDFVLSKLDKFIWNFFIIIINYNFIFFNVRNS